MERPGWPRAAGRFVDGHRAQVAIHKETPKPAS